MGSEWKACAEYRRRRRIVPEFSRITGESVTFASMVSVGIRLRNHGATRPRRGFRLSTPFRAGLRAPLSSILPERRAARENVPELRLFSKPGFENRLAFPDGLSHIFSREVENICSEASILHGRRAGVFLWPHSIQKSRHLSAFLYAVRPGRIELPTNPWQGLVIPLNHGRMGCMVDSVYENREKATAVN